MKQTRLLCVARQYVSVTVPFALLLCQFALLLSPVIEFPPLILTAEAAEVTVTNSESSTAVQHIHATAQTVFTSDTVGYRFFVDSAGECSYVKTTDGGVSWGGVLNKVDDQGAAADCVSINIWYDKWTPGDTGDYIHIVTMDTGSDDLFYNRLDTTDDSLLSGSTAVLFSTAAGYPTVSLNAGANYPSIAKATDGVLYVSIDEATANGSTVFMCSSSCSTATNWSMAGTSPQDDVNDWSILAPILDGDMMLINRDVSADDIRTQIWNGSSWSGSWFLIDGNATENSTYDIGMSAVSDSSGNISLAFLADTATLGTNDDLRTARYNGISWASTTAIVTNSSRGLTQVSTGFDANTNVVYVAYSAQTSAGTANTGRVYWHTSADNMTSWSGETGPVNANAGDLYGVDVNNFNDERIFASWADMTGGTIQGDTIADIYGGVAVGSNATQTSEVRASTTNVYIGGAFAFTENASSREVTSITISEDGTVDAENGLDNIKLFYENDSTLPYNCASESYNGTENQYGSTDTNGFSGANGVSAFSDAGVVVSTSSALCVYVVMDVTAAAADTSTINVYIADPASDVTVSSGGDVVPATTVSIAGTTTVRDSKLTQEHFHFRNDNGSETTATSRTAGTQDTDLTSLQQGTSTRLRIEVSNEGSSSSLPTAFTLEFAESALTCSAATGWTDVGAADDAFNMSNTANLTDGDNTTNIAIPTGGVTDENSTFLAVNGGVRDTSSQTGSLTLSTTTFAEFEFSITASTSAVQGSTYCFRLTNSGMPLPVYDVYPRVTISSDVRVAATSSQTATIDIPSTNRYIGGTFVISEQSSARDVTAITVSEQGTVDAQTGLDNIQLRYDLDTSAPYNCASESYSGSEAQFGSTDTDGFSAADGSSSFVDSVGIDTTSTLCIYVVLDVTTAAFSGETVDVYIQSPNTDVAVSAGGSVSPSTPVNISGSSTLQGAIMTQTHFHFRNDDGSESGATSATGGVDDTPYYNVARQDPFRLRIQVSNEGSTSSVPTALALEYGTKITTCANIGTWNRVGSTNGAFAMYNTGNLTQGSNTTNIAEAAGGMPDENTTFKIGNAGVNDTSAVSATTTLTTTEFIEAEFSIESTVHSGYNTNYCFRLTNNGSLLNSYTSYAELTTAPKRDFKVQRGSTTVTSTSTTITAGVHYEAPASSTRAFIRITNTHNTGAGRDASGGNQNADDVSVYIENPSNLLTSVRFTRPPAAINNTRVDWEIVEYIGDAGGDNEIIVRRQAEVRYGTADVATSTAAINGVIDDADIVVFITGAFSPDTALTDYEAMQSTAEWNSVSDTATFTRGVSGSDAVRLSYAVVEFVGAHWKVQRAEHTYAVAGDVESENITAVNNLSRAFIHTQKRMTNGLQSMADFGHEVWLSSIGVVSFRIDSLASTPAGHTSVVWVIENTQMTVGAMEVHRIDGSTSAGTEPLTLSVAIGDTVAAMDNTSVSGNSRLSQTGTNYPRPIAGLILASTTAVNLWRSDTGGTLTYRVEVIEWPVSELAFRQNYYRFYVDNGGVTPSDAWPPGGTDIGENAAITSSDTPVADGQLVRLRMSIRVTNATFPDNNQSFKLQYARRISTCSAIGSWTDVGAAGSGAIWRGYNGTSTDGTTLPSTLLSVSDVAATFEEENNSATNPSVALAGEDVEYDWTLQHNGAVQRSDYCFRMVYSDGTPLSIYVNYPTLRTAGYTPTVMHWRWYNDEENVTPTDALAGENVAPSNVVNGEVLKLRVSLKEINGANGENVKLGLQFSQYADFSDGGTYLTSTTSCSATSTWCYADGAGLDNATITAKVISDSESCSAGTGSGCGTHNESLAGSSTLYHASFGTKEFEFTIRQGIPRVGGVYYFRMWDIVNDTPVSASTSYPSLMTQGPILSFSVSGLPSGTTTEGIVTDIATTPTALSFGTLQFDTVTRGAHRLSVSTNATEGYRMFVTTDQQLTDEYGNTIAGVSGTNAAPLSWATGCNASSTGCFGYHAGDDVLESGSARFAANDTYAQLTTNLDEVMYSAVPTVESHDIVYAISVTEGKEAGSYENGITYIAVPVY